MEELLKQFEQQLLADTMSPDVVKAYIRYVKRFIKTLEINKVDDITKPKINEYFINLNNSLAETSVNKHKGAVGSFINNFLNLDMRIPKQKVPFKKIMRVITKEELENQIDKAIDRIFDNPIQIKAVLYFMFYSGLRVREVAKIKREAFNFNNHRAISPGFKSRQERIIPLNEKTEKYLQLYFAIGPENKVAFNMAKRTIQSIFEKLNDFNALPDVHLKAHLFKHSNITHQIKQGMALSSVQKIAGHKNIQTTQQYEHLDDDFIVEEFRKKVK